MNFELRNLKINEAFSEETTCFIATLYIDGVRTAECRNDGHGGMTLIQPLPGKRDVQQEAEAYCKTLPPIHLQTIDIPSDLESVVDLLVDKELKRRFWMKLQKSMEKKLVIQKGDKVYTIGWGKQKLPTFRPQSSRALSKGTRSSTPIYHHDDTQTKMVSKPPRAPEEQRPPCDATG